MTGLVIDARMVQSSGIGTVIANVSRRLIEQNPGWRFVLLGEVSVLARLDWTKAQNVELASFSAPIYSLREQFDIPVRATSGCNVMWSPNYNMLWPWNGRLAVTVHDVAHLALPEMRQSLTKQIYARTMFARVRQRADAILFTSAFSMTEFQRFVGVPKGRQIICPNGVDESWFDAPPFTDAPKRPFILFVGNVKPHKNLMRLLEAYDRIRDVIPHDLKIVGRKDGFITSDDEVVKRVDDFGGRVVFTGHVSNAELRALFAKADALVLPSLYEGFGLPPLEAMAAGCPTLVARAASLPEVCGDASLYCDPRNVNDIGEQMVRLVTDHNVRTTLKARGRERARAFSWTSCANTYRDAFLDLAV